MGIEIIEKWETSPGQKDVTGTLSEEDIEDLLDIVSELGTLSKIGRIYISLPNGVNVTQRLEELERKLNKLRYS